ncbi:MAG TPA: phospho-N-acetylmuramoyl-pentapeptide-transferase [Dehalococcoidia bacterium]|nr:phospho-N-acetylmuramoyl-pentapeptide-transferase [Dehalococcoidia bacterium]
MVYPLVTAGVAFLMALVAGSPIIAFLRERNVGKDIRPEGPESHAMKQGTPTMGGIIILIPVVITTLLLNAQGRSVYVPLATLVANGLVGLSDDVRSLVGSAGSGFSVRAKFALLLALAASAALVLHYGLQLESVYLPFTGKIPIGLWYVPVALVTIVATANAVNLTDGLDALAGGTAALAFAAYGIIAFLQEQTFLATFSFTLVGAILGFLWYNAYPAQVFMGDTGALALGATLAVVAMMTGHWLLLPLIGIVFVAETVSVILQVAYFKLSGGKRIFLMSPLHHHFELLGWSEPQVTMRFWLVGMLAAMAGIALALL